MPKLSEVLPDFLLGAAQGYQSIKQDQRQRRNRLEELGYEAQLRDQLAANQAEREMAQIEPKATAEQRAKAAFPSAEEQAKARVLELADDAARLPLEPIDPIPRRVNLAPASTATNMQGFLGAAKGSRQHELDLLSYLLPRQSSMMLTPVIFDQNTGKYLDQSGQEVRQITRGTPVRSLPLSEDTIQRRAAAQSRGSGTGKEKTILQAKSALNQLEGIYQLAETKLPAIRDNPNNPLPEGMEAIGGGIVRKLGSQIGLNESARAFLSTNVANARQTIRGLGEVGVLTDKDVEHAITLLPASTDSVTVRRDKLAGLRELIRRKLDIYEATPGERSPAQGQLEGSIILKGGRRWRVVGMDTDGDPLVEPAE